MKKKSANNISTGFQLSALFTMLICLGVFLVSFTVKTGDDFLKQMGMSKSEADGKIANSILGGSLDAYGLRNIKNIASGNKAGIATDLLSYTKRQVNAPGFIKQYKELRESKKPRLIITQTPEEMHTERVAFARKSLASIETSAKSADASQKKLYDKMISDAKKTVAEAENPRNYVMTSYRQRYPQDLKDAEAMNQNSLSKWEAKYPSNHLLFIKLRLQEFMNETKDIDFNAELVTKNGKKVFVNPAYEGKGSRWKMAFRAGKEVVETSRVFVQKWMEEIK